jgi:hypothetical protein
MLLLMTSSSASAESFSAAASSVFSAVRPGFKALAASRVQPVNARISRSAKTHYWANEGYLGINLSADAFNGGMHFSGFPFSGSVSGSGTYFSINGGAVSGSIRAWGSSYDVDATIYEGGRSKHVSLHLWGSGGDREHLPRFSVSDTQGAARLSANPAFDGSGYDVNGTVDGDRFGKNETALVVLATIVAWHHLTNPPTP